MIMTVKFGLSVCNEKEIGKYTYNLFVLKDRRITAPAAAASMSHREAPGQPADLRRTVVEAAPQLGLLRRVPASQVTLPAQVDRLVLFVRKE